MLYSNDKRQTQTKKGIKYRYWLRRGAVIMRMIEGFTAGCKKEKEEYVDVLRPLVEFVS